LPPFAVKGGYPAIAFKEMKKCTGGRDRDRIESHKDGIQTEKYVGAECPFPHSRRQ